MFGKRCDETGARTVCMCRTEFSCLSWFGVWRQGLKRGNESETGSDRVREDEEEEKEGGREREREREKGRKRRGGGGDGCLIFLLFVAVIPTVGLDKCPAVKSWFTRLHGEPNVQEGLCKALEKSSFKHIRVGLWYYK